MCKALINVARLSPSRLTRAIAVWPPGIAFTHSGSTNPTSACWWRLSVKNLCGVELGLEPLAHPRNVAVIEDPWEGRGGGAGVERGLRTFDGAACERLTVTVTYRSGQEIRYTDVWPARRSLCRPSRAVWRAHDSGPFNKPRAGEPPSGNCVPLCRTQAGLFAVGPGRRESL